MVRLGRCVGFASLREQPSLDSGMAVSPFIGNVLDLETAGTEVAPREPETARFSLPAPSEASDGGRPMSSPVNFPIGSRTRNRKDVAGRRDPVAQRQRRRCPAQRQILVFAAAASRTADFEIAR